MAGIIKVFLLLAVVVCIAKAQLNEAGQSCLCQRVRNGSRTKLNIRDIQIYPATTFCDRVEIVVTSERGRYCLNPELEKVKRLITQIMKIKKTTTSKPTGVSFTSSSSSSSSNSAATRV